MLSDVMYEPVPWSPATQHPQSWLLQLSTLLILTGVSVQAHSMDAQVQLQVCACVCGIQKTTLGVFLYQSHLIWGNKVYR